MAQKKQLLKVGLALVKHDHLLVVRKKGTDTFILPGGKPEGDELDLDTLRRELQEELGCDLVTASYEGDFSDVAAHSSNIRVTVRLYVGELRGTPHPSSEIEELAWIDLCSPAARPLAPSITNQILPHLCARNAADDHSKANTISPLLTKQV